MECPSGRQAADNIVHRLIYLHGFASGPQSGKGQFFRQRWAEIGHRLELPDLTQGEFEHSTLTQQLTFLDTLVSNDSAILLGSSLGGYLAALFAARHRQRVPGVVLLAPAFGFARRWGESLGEQTMGEWRERGWRPIYHYGEEKERRIGYSLLGDGLQYEEFPVDRQPALAIHGRYDQSVDHQLSVRFAEGRSNVELVLYESDHQLLDVLEPMWERVREFVAGLGLEA